MTYSSSGKIIKGVGGLYEIKLSSATVHPLAGKTVFCRARGVLRYNGISPLVGDNVAVSYDESSFAYEGETARARDDGRGIVIGEITERKNSLIRPPVANLDTIFVVMAAASPTPILETVDKLIFIAEFNGIEPVIVISKSDLGEAKAKEIEEIYKLSGFDVFVVSAGDDDSTKPLEKYIEEHLSGKIAAFAGASGVGKSTLINKLFPTLGLAIGEVSRKTERGRHTTRHVELFEVECRGGIGYIADTPGFTMLDFAQFNFFTKDDLPFTVREFSRYIGECKYTKCTHTKEDGCAILAALERGEIAKSRHDSFLSIYETLKNKPTWEKPQETRR